MGYANSYRIVQRIKWSISLLQVKSRLIKFTARLNLHKLKKMFRKLNQMHINALLIIINVY